MASDAQAQVLRALKEAGCETLLSNDSLTLCKAVDNLFVPQGALARIVQYASRFHPNAVVTRGGSAAAGHGGDHLFVLNVHAEHRGLALHSGPSMSPLQGRLLEEAWHCVASEDEQELTHTLERYLTGKRNICSHCCRSLGTPEALEQHQKCHRKRLPRERAAPYHGGSVPGRASTRDSAT